jgi:1-deoxy-D-xylulose-5-phosphate reductoisomerase
MRRVSIFGSTGSIGQNTLDLVRKDPSSYHIVALTGGRNIKQLVKDAREFRPEIVVTAFSEFLPVLRAGVFDLGIEATAGELAISDAADRPVDWVMSAIIGIAGLVPSLNAVKQGATLALANKESLVAAGPLLLAQAAKHSATILPVDSEHSAVFQALLGEDISTVERIIITASGGAFRDWPQADLAKATPAQAQTHPNWTMGQRVTIDSASLFNKAMELIETKEFFGVKEACIETIIHPESLVHAIVGFNDGGMMAHVGPPDMRHSIGFALHHPTRMPLDVARLDFAKIGQFQFLVADDVRYPALRLAREVMNKGHLWGTSFNAAKEVALDRFIACEIGFLDMAILVENVLNDLDKTGSMNLVPRDLQDILKADEVARRIARNLNV